MADIVNLRTARKQRDRAEARRHVAARTGDVAETAKAEAALVGRRHEGHRLESEAAGTQREVAGAQRGTRAEGDDQAGE